MAKKIFVTRNIPGPGLLMLHERGYDVVVSKKARPLSRKELVAALKKDEYDAIFSLLTDTIDAEVLSAALRVKIISNYAVGVNNIDLAECKKRGILVTNTPGVLSETVSEHTFALILALTTRIVEADSFVKKGKYKGWDPELFLGTELRGKTIGIVGGGDIGGRVACHAHLGFGMNVVYHDIKKNEMIEEKCGGKMCDSLESLLKMSDIVSLHVPLMESTRHLINEARLNMMKNTAYLVNTSRGPVVDEVALVKALQEGKIRGAGLDVFEFEPSLAPGLAKLPNVVLTPHIASATTEARNEMSRLAAQNIIDFFEGKTPQHIVQG